MKRIVTMTASLCMAVSLSTDAYAQAPAPESDFSFVAFVDLLPGTTESELLTAWQRFSEAVSHEGGDPLLIRLGDHLENEGSTVPVRLPGDFLMIARYPDRAGVEPLRGSAAPVPALGELRTLLEHEVSMITTAPPGQQPPALSAAGAREAPAFLLVNPIDMQNDPELAGRVAEYSATAFPLVQSQGVRFTEAYAVVEVLRGETSMDVLYITDWPDIDTFHGVHTNPEWLEVVPIRNIGVAALSDIQGFVVRAPH